MYSAIALLCALHAAFGQTVPCGVPVVQPVTSRITGGKDAVPGSWPWMVMLVDDLGYISGSAFILGKHTLLTSAQHFEGANYHLADVNTAQWAMYFGAHNINTEGPHERNYTIKSVTVHERFNTTTLENDLALIYTNEEIVYNDHTRPICLPDPGHQYSVGQMCYLAGWGATTGNANDEVLNQVDLPILADTACQQHYQDFLPSTELCAGYEMGGKDFCSDDIGSPLMCKDTSGSWYAQGIASSGGDCTRADEPGIFEDVSKYTQWIKNQMSSAGFPYEY